MTVTMSSCSHDTADCTITHIDKVLSVSKWFGGLKVTRQLLDPEASSALLLIAQQNRVGGVLPMPWSWLSVCGAGR